MIMYNDYNDFNDYNDYNDYNSTLSPKWWLYDYGVIEWAKCPHILFG